MSVATHGDPQVALDIRIPTQRRGTDAPAPRTAPRTGHSMQALAVVTDLVSVTATLAAAAIWRDVATFLPRSGEHFATTVAVAAPLIALGWIANVAALGGYERSVFGVGTDEYRRVFNASFVTAAVVSIVCYLTAVDLSRGFFVLTLLLGPVAMVSGRALLRRGVRAARRGGALLHRVLIVGTQNHIDEVARVVDRESWLGFDVVGALTPEQSGAEHTPGGIPLLGKASSVVDVAGSVQADVIFLAGGAVDSAADLREIVWELEDSATQVIVAPSVTDVSRERIRIRPVGGLPLLHLEKPRSANATRRAKRTFDLVGASLLLIAFAPIFLFAAARIWLFDRGPVLFRQERIGRDGKPFACLKFRTMVVDADRHAEQVLAAAGEAVGLFAKAKEDPRITRPGRWLRRYSVDELPQLLNVVRGDMSLIGPRPQVAREVALYDRAMARRLRVRPGMTGLWQVSGRSNLTPAEAIRLDLYYVDNWSMLQDLTILAKTASAVIGSEGAY